MRKRSPGQPVVKLPTKRRGRPLLIGDHLETEVRQFLEAIRRSGSVVNTEVTVGTAIGVVTSYDANLLAENGSPFDITPHWARRLLGRMGLVKRRGTTKAKVDPTDFEGLKKQYLADIRTKLFMEDILADLIINWDHTGLKYVPVSNWTMEVKGTKRVEIVSSDDKRQLTTLFSCTISGKFPPPQVIYAGKTPACLPKAKVPDGWNVTYTPNHWSNEQTMMIYLHTILIPYIEETRAELKLSNTHQALVIFEGTDNGRLPSSYNISFVEVPAHCTDILQPLDLSINKPVKDHLKASFQEWYAVGIKQRVLAGNDNKRVIDLRLSLLKPLGFQWLEKACDYIKGSDFVVNGFRAAGITDILSDIL